METFEEAITLRRVPKMIMTLKAMFVTGKFEKIMNNNLIRTIWAENFIYF